MNPSCTYGVIALLGTVTMIACSDDDTATTMTGATTGTGGTTATTTGTGGTTGEGGMGTGGIGTGGAGVGGTGAGGEAACYSCNAYITQCAAMQGQCPPEEQLCSGGDVLFDALKTCACNECANECQLTCTGQGQDMPTCITCYQTAAGTACTAELQSCQADT